jgi:RNA-directed DNA polymerase
VAKGNRKLRFTALLHHVTVDLLRSSYHNLKKGAAPGVDGLTWQDLWTRPGGAIERPARADPSRGIPSAAITKNVDPEKRWKATTIGHRGVGRQSRTARGRDGSQPDLGRGLSGFSYGFRPGRNQHNALDALYVGITRRKVNWALDLDICAFFDRIDHAWMIKFVEHRTGDRRIVRLIQKWLKAGVMEQGRWIEAEQGTPQGSVNTPLTQKVIWVACRS